MRGIGGACLLFGLGVMLEHSFFQVAPGETWKLVVGIALFVVGLALVGLDEWRKRAARREADRLKTISAREGGIAERESASAEKADPTFAEDYKISVEAASRRLMDQGEHLKSAALLFKRKYEMEPSEYLESLIMDGHQSGVCALYGRVPPGDDLVEIPNQPAGRADQYSDLHVAASDLPKLLDAYNQPFNEHGA